MEFGWNWCGSKSPVSEQSSREAPHAAGYGLAKGRAGPSAAEPPSKSLKGEMQEASEAARGKKLPSRVYLPSKVWRPAPGMVRLTLTLM